MPADFPYMTTAKILAPTLERIKGAGAPPKFTLEFLKTLRFPSSSDRPVNSVLKGLGFLSQDGVPTQDELWDGAKYLHVKVWGMGKAEASVDELVWMN